MNLNPALAAVVADLTPRFPDLRDVAVHGGAFTERELVLWLDRVPGLRVGVLGLNGIQPRGRDGWQADLRWSAYVFTTDTATTDRLTLAVDTVETLLKHLVSGATWNLPCQPPQLDSIQAETLYTGHVNLLSVALWAVAWTQTHYFS